MAHTVRPMPSIPSAGAGLALAVQAHAVGWPIPVGGTGAIVDALVVPTCSRTAAASRPGAPSPTSRDLPPARAIVFDTSVPALLAIAGSRLPALLRAWLRTVRFGSGIGKVDFALDGPVPWLDETARTRGHPPPRRIRGTRSPTPSAPSPRAACRSRPYVLVAQPSVLDATRAPAGKHVLWAYTHLPNGSTLDPTALISDAIERVAPGFRDLVLAANARSAADIGAWDPNLGGGDIAAGAVTLRQLLARPMPSPEPVAPRRRDLPLLGGRGARAGRARAGRLPRRALLPPPRVRDDRAARPAVTARQRSAAVLDGVAVPERRAPARAHLPSSRCRRLVT